MSISKYTYQPNQHSYRWPNQQPQESLNHPQFIPQHPHSQQQHMLFPMSTSQENWRNYQEINTQDLPHSSFPFPGQQDEFREGDVPKRLTHQPVASLENLPSSYFQNHNEHQSYPRWPQKRQEIFEQDINKISLERQQDQNHNRHQKYLEYPTNSTEIIPPSYKAQKPIYRPSTQRSLIKSVYEEDIQGRNKTGNITKNYHQSNQRALGIHNNNKSYRQIPRYMMEGTPIQTKYEPLQHQKHRPSQYLREDQYEDELARKKDILANRQQIYRKQEKYIDAIDPKKQSIDYYDRPQYLTKAAQMRDPRNYLDKQHLPSSTIPSTLEQASYQQYKKLPQEYFQPKRNPNLSTNYRVSNQYDFQPPEYVSKLNKNYDHAFQQSLPYDEAGFYEKSQPDRLIRPSDKPELQFYNKYYNYNQVPKPSIRQDYTNTSLTSNIDLKNQLRNITNRYGQEYGGSTKKLTPQMLNINKYSNHYANTVSKQSQVNLPKKDISGLGSAYSNYGQSKYYENDRSYSGNYSKADINRHYSKSGLSTLVGRQTQIGKPKSDYRQQLNPRRN